MFFFFFFQGGVITYCVCVQRKKKLIRERFRDYCVEGGGVLKDEIYGSYSIVRPTTR